MAERRMFAKTIIDSDAFLDMPMSAQALYFHLGMRADDDGFVNAPRKIQRTVGASEDDLKLLVAKRFILVFESGVIVIKHWRIHNYIQSDRYKPTLYKDEMATLKMNENNAYTERDGAMYPECIQDVSILDTQVRLGKDSLGEDSLDSSSHRFALPLNDNTNYFVSDEDIDKWRGLYPAVDVEQQLRNMRGWLDSHPDRRKTKRGINAFITAWLSKEQDKAPARQTQAPRVQNGPSYTSGDPGMAKYVQRLKQQREGKA